MRIAISGKEKDTRPSSLSEKSISLGKVLYLPLSSGWNRPILTKKRVQMVTQETQMDFSDRLLEKRRTIAGWLDVEVKH